MQIYLNKTDELKLKELARLDGMSVAAFVRSKCLVDQCQIGKVKVLSQKDLFINQIRLVTGLNTYNANVLFNSICVIADKYIITNSEGVDIALGLLRQKTYINRNDMLLELETLIKNGVTMNSIYMETTANGEGQ
jgi:hypothetical protein